MTKFMPMFRLCRPNCLLYHMDIISLHISVYIALIKTVETFRGGFISINFLKFSIIDCCFKSYSIIVDAAIKQLL